MNLKTMLPKKLMAPLLALTLTPAAYGKVFQDLSYTYEVKPGMKASEVLNIMGDAPAAMNTENERYTEWHYCQTVKGLNEYFAVFLWNGEVVAGTKRYVVGKSNGLGRKSCENYIRLGSFSIPSDLSVQLNRFDWEETVYNIDTVKITEFKNKNSAICELGSETKLLIEGVIGPDTSFALRRLLGRIPKCTSAEGQELVPVTISLRSGGGLLNDGYKMAEALREFKAKTIIEDGNACASSCAVAFLGGDTRVVEEKGIIMFHAPYFDGRNEYGERDINCDVGEDALAQLKTFYESMTDSEISHLLFDRTMWYCSADDGWVVTGGAAAELYGIATER